VLCATCGKTCGDAFSTILLQMHIRPPSIDPGVIAFIWAVVLGAFIYFGLLAVGASGAFAFVIAFLSFAAIWFFVRLRGEDRPGT